MEERIETEAEENSTMPGFQPPSNTEAEVQQNATNFVAADQKNKRESKAPMAEENTSYDLMVDIVGTLLQNQEMR